MKTTKQSVTIKADPTWRIGIVHADYYPKEIKPLIDGAVKTLEGAGATPGNIKVVPTPGAFEVPLLGAYLAESGTVDALIGLGIIVEGHTHHAQLLAEATTNGMMDVQIKYRLPFAFEILYADSIEQIRLRAGEECNKGEEAAVAVLRSLAEMAKIKSDA